MTTYRHPDRQRYVKVDPTPIRSTPLSLAAKGLWVYMLDKPDDWTFAADRIAADPAVAVGRGAVQTAMRELVGAGLVRFVRERDDRGRSRTRIDVREHVDVAWPDEAPDRTGGRIPTSGAVSPEGRYRAPVDRAPGNGPPYGLPVTDDVEEQSPSRRSENGDGSRVSTADRRTVAPLRAAGVGDEVDLASANGIARFVFGRLEELGWNRVADDPLGFVDADAERQRYARRTNGIASVVGYACAVDGRRRYEFPTELDHMELSWAETCDALTAPLGFVLPQGRDEWGVRETWGSRAAWPTLDPAQERDVLIGLRAEWPPGDTDVPVGRHVYGVGEPR